MGLKYKIFQDYINKNVLYNALNNTINVQYIELTLKLEI